MSAYRALGSDLLPAMDEGGFILDYVMPAGSSLQETNRVISHVEQIVRSVPEVESTSRRTGLQLGLAAVTEANTGDISVKLKGQAQQAAIDEIISEIRAKVENAGAGARRRLHASPSGHDRRPDRALRSPSSCNFFPPTRTLLQTWAPRVADALGSIYINNKKPVVDIEDGIDNTTSGPAVLFTVNPETAAEAGFTTDQLTTVASAMVDGEPATTPVIINDRPYTLRVRFPAATRASLEAMSNTMLVNSTGGTATLGALATVTELPGQTEILRDNLQREVEVTARLEGLDLGTGVAAVQKAVNDLNLPPSIRVEYGGTYQEQQKSFHDLDGRSAARAGADLPGSAVRVPRVLGAHRDSVFGRPFDLGSLPRPADHADDVQCFLLHRA